MADRPAAWSEPQLERALLDLGQHLEYPPTPDITGAVRRRLLQRKSMQPVGIRRRLQSLETVRFWRWRVWSQPVRVAVAALLALVVLAATILAVSPEARTAVAERLGLRGVQISQIPAPPTPAATPPSATAEASSAAPPGTAAVPTTSSVTPPGAAASPAASYPAGSTGVRLNLGRPTSLDALRTQVSFPVEVPADLGVPDEVYLLDNASGGQVALVYYPRADLPAANTTGVGLLLTEFQGNVHSTGATGKGVPPGTRLESLQVNGGQAYWLEGDPHTFFYVDPRGIMRTETTRLAGNVLLWEHGNLTLRIESVLSKDAAVRIASATH
jgi:hypothetical protein